MWLYLLQEESIRIHSNLCFPNAIPFHLEIPRFCQRIEEGRLAAFIVEPIQGEGGIIESPVGYLKEAENLYEENGTLLIADEIQTGFGRTGEMFVVHHENANPDIMTIAKSLGGGLMPIEAYTATDEVWQKIR